MVLFISKLGYIILTKVFLLRTLFYHYYKYGNSAPRKNEIIYVDPKLIEGHLRSTLKVWKTLKMKAGSDGSAIIGGNWDKEGVEYLSFIDLEVFKSCYAHWIEGKSWEETPFYQNYFKLIENNKPTRFKSHKDLRDRYNRLDEIFNTIKIQGKMSTNSKDLVKISMNREGGLIWGPDGKHRICIALCTGLKKIPASIGFIHTDAIENFQKVRN